MKNLRIYLLTGLIILTASGLKLNAATNALMPVSDSTSLAQIAETSAMMARITEIKEMDKSTLSFSEKRALRKETKALKSKLIQPSGGVYISAGALLVGLILLIILL